MDCLHKKGFSLTIAAIAFCLTTSASYARAGYFQLHNLMSAAQKNVPNNIIYNDKNLNLEAQERNTGHVVNTMFANDGGMGGCGVTSTLMQYIYQNTGTVDLSKNYIALNVYSQVMGFDPQAPFWGGAEGGLKGYLTTGATVAYPFTPYHRVIPSLYPAYLGLYNNGLNCGRWVQADFDNQACQDRTTPEGISKFCPNVPGLTYAGLKMQAYVFDSCEDNNGWCRDDAAHIDVNAAAVPNNLYLQWKFIRNPYYADPKAPSWLKDVWFAWFSQASRYWSYLAVLNAENGVANLAYNIGDVNNPTWINSHVLAGDNNVTWVSTSNNGQLWQVEPTNALTDAGPPVNPTYQVRLFDPLGYPANHGTIYQFKLLFDDGTLGQNVAGYYFFYQGGSKVKAGNQTQNMTLLTPPIGNGSITIAFNQLLPSNVSLDKAAANYLRPVLISDDGYSFDPDNCLNNQCVFSKLVTAEAYHVFAHAVQDVSNDLTLRKVNDVAINSGAINFANGTNAVTYALKANEINLSTLYSARVQIPLSFATSSQTPINGNLQALFVPDKTRNALANITAQTQGCFLSTYVNAMTDTGHKVAPFNGNNSICTVYYTVNNQSVFRIATSPPAAFFTVLVPSHVGFDPVNYALSKPYSSAVQVIGYNPTGTPVPLPTTKSVPMVNYLTGTGTSRSLYLLLDPDSDAICLQKLDKTLGVSVTIGNAPTLNLTAVDVPVETQIPPGIGSMTAQVHLVANANVNCQAMLAFTPSPGSPLKPGIDVVQVIKLVAMPTNIPKPVTQGIAATAAGDNACLGGLDTLLFSNNGGVQASVPYTLSSVSTNVGVKATAGVYTISDQAFNVPGGTCQLSAQPSVTIQNNTYTPVTLNYRFTPIPSATCIANATVTAAWPSGCTIQMTLNATSPLKNITLSWVKGLFDWTHAEVWGGEGSLNIPTNASANVTWAMPTWVNAQGSVVGMNVNNDGTPSICGAFQTSGINVKCAGIATAKK